ncbi:nickel-binding protein, partial [Methyloceanibacter marginalis]|uniref:nickel-binding protein n=1 Tax=Methyloceanibacter marginalis TaxID=1774971 RepID=UPI003CC7A877
MSLKKFVIERDIPKVGTLNAEELAGAAAKSNAALCQIGAKDIQWVQSYVAGDKTSASISQAMRARSKSTRSSAAFPQPRSLRSWRSSTRRRPAKLKGLGFWWSQTGSNRRPRECHSRA